jgi:hypothetical protein
MDRYAVLSLDGPLTVSQVLLSKNRVGQAPKIVLAGDIAVLTRMKYSSSLL